MLSKILDAFFGCWHNHYSFPITVRPGTRRSKAASLTGTYVVCLDCGKEFPYDWREMKVVSPLSGNANRAASLATKEAGESEYSCFRKTCDIRRIKQNRRRSRRSIHIQANLNLILVVAALKCRTI